jgi:hypothetical protein
LQSSKRNLCFFVVEINITWSRVAFDAVGVCGAAIWRSIQKYFRSLKARMYWTILHPGSIADKKKKERTWQIKNDYPPFHPL